MSDNPQHLERAYRRLMRSYPAAYRARRGDEILATYLDVARPGQRRPHRNRAAGRSVRSPPPALCCASLGRPPR